MEEANPAVESPALASYSSGDDVSKLRHPEPEFPRAKVSADSETALFQPSLDSPVTVSSHFSSDENGGMEAVASAHDSTSASSRDVDNTSKLSYSKLEPELQRGETSNDSKAETCQPSSPSPSTGSTPLSSVEDNGMEEAVPAAYGSASSGDDDDNVNHRHLEAELARTKVSAGFETATCPPLLLSQVSGTSPSPSVEKNGMKETVLSADGLTCDSSSNVNNASKLSSTHLEPKLSGGKASADSETVKSQPPLPGLFSDLSPFLSDEKNGMEGATPAHVPTSGSSSGDDNDNKVSNTHPEPALQRAKMPTGSKTAARLPPLPSSVTGTSPSCSIGKSGLEEVKPALGGPASASHSNDDDNVSKPRQLVPKLPRRKVSADLETGPFQPPFPSPNEKKGMKAVSNTEKPTSASLRDDDNASELSNTYQEPEIRREELSAGSKTATRQQPLRGALTGSLSLSFVQSSGTEEAVHTADGPSAASSSSDDNDNKLSNTHPEPALQRAKMPTGSETAARLPPLPSSVTGTSPSCSIEKSGLEEAKPALDGPASASHSNDDDNVGKPRQLVPKLPRRKVSADVKTGPFQPPFPSPNEKKGMKAVSNTEKPTSASLRDDDNASELSNTYQEPEIRREELSAGSKTATRQQPLRGALTGSLSLSFVQSSGTEEAVHTADGPSAASSSSDDNDNKLSNTHPEPALQRAKMPTGSETAARLPPLPSSVTGTSPSCSIEKSGLEEAKPALDGPASASHSNDDDNVGKPRQLVPKLPRRKVSADVKTGPFQPPFPSPDEKNGMEAVPNTEKPTSASPRDDDNASELSNTYQEPEIRREELSAGSKTATRQQPLRGAVTGSLPLSFVQSSGVEEAVHTADDPSAPSSSSDDNAIKLSSGKVSADSEMATCQSPPVLLDKVNDAEQAVPAAGGQTSISYNNDVSELSTACPEPELAKGKVLTSSEKPICQPPLPIPLPRSSRISLVKNGTREATPSADGRTSILSSSGGDGDTRKHSSRWPELPRRKVSNDLGTATHQPPPVTGSSHIYSGGMNMQNGMENATPADSDRAAISPSDDGDSSMLSSTQQEPEKPVFVFGVTLPSGKQMSAIAAVHVGTTSGKSASVTCGICGGQNVKEVSCQLTESGGLLSVSPQDLEETSEELEQESSFAALATVKVEPTLSSSVSSPSMSCQENEPAEAHSAGKLNMSVSISPGGAANMVLVASTSRVFEFGVTLPNRREPAPPNSPFHGVVNSGKDVFSVNMSSSPQGYDTISKNKATPGPVVEADVEKEEFCSSSHENESTAVEHTDVSDIQTPHELVAGHEFQSDEKMHESPEDLPRGRLSDKIKELREHLRKSKGMLTTSSPSKAHPETSAELFTFGSPSASSTHQFVDLSPEARPSTSTTRPSTTAIFRSSSNLGASTPVAAAQSLASVIAIRPFVLLGLLQCVRV
ncbi:hypothetical protein HPB50_003997 [Hyalomma asiaticum]|uniref:Uncharacterized protein n=1 Tax=Hyalomma asiaticum TaxID=266040 RepID=A0ACB7SS29_HYAAI|nr:hypothetical protein HPB50_003997 [Hyalomma asiaticum]